MLKDKIVFSCRCGRRLTALVGRNPPTIRFQDHGRRMRNHRCPTPGCGHDYSRITAEEFKEQVFAGF
ncbi:MAG: hypothetical protein ABFC63_09615 [Thermoguttaceae bacterium]